MTTIRVAGADDIPGIADLGREALTLSRYASEAQFDPDIAVGVGLEMLARQRTGAALMLVASEEDQGLTGCFCGLVTPLYGTTARIIENQFFFVSPRARKTTALRLMRTFMRWGERIEGQAYFRFVMTDAIGDLDSKDRAMKALGFRQTGAMYEKEIA